MGRLGGAGVACDEQAVAVISWHYGGGILLSRWQLPTSQPLRHDPQPLSVAAAIACRHTWLRSGEHLQAGAVRGCQ